MIVPASLDDLPPSAKLVYVALAVDGPTTASDIQRRTRLPKRTVHGALDELDQVDAIATSPNYPDTRSTVYRIILS